jgi:protein-S-isoprenylcysteine O-methyltransferase Ste14
MFRIWALVVLLTSVAISGYYRARARTASGTIGRRREGGAALAARAAGGLGAFGAILLHAIAPGTMAWASFAAEDAVRWTGAALGLVAIPGTFWVLSSLGRNVSETVLTKERHELVQHGPYRWIRHPLYTLGIGLLLAQGLMLASWLVLLFALLAFVIFRFLVVPIEERQLEARFGDAYRRYRRLTGVMAPKLF